MGGFVDGLLEGEIIFRGFSCLADGLYGFEGFHRFGLDHVWRAFGKPVIGVLDRVMPSYDHILSMLFLRSLISQTMNPSTLLQRQYLGTERFKLRLLNYLLLSLFVLTSKVIHKILSWLFFLLPFCLCILLKLLS